MYTLTRVATLVMVAINLFNLDAATPIDCQVCAIFFLTSFGPPSDKSCSQDYDGFPVCMRPITPQSFEDEVLSLAFPFSLGLSLPSPRFLFVVDRASNVRFPQVLWQPFRNS